MKIIILILLSFFIYSCVEENSNAFHEDTIVEAFLIVDEPIQNIRVMHTIPILDTFKFENAVIDNANILIYSDSGDSLYLEYNNKIYKYQAINSNYLIKENTNYNLRIIINNDTITGQTLTPKKFKWMIKLPDLVQYPKDSIHLSDVVKLSWENTNSFNYYHIALRCLDTLNYGSYLSPPTNELNRRLSLFKSSEYFFKNTTNHGLAPSNEGSLVWTSFKWYGLQELTIYNPDFNWFRWLGQYYQNEYNDLLNSVKGKRARGVFGSATAVRDTFFLEKNIK